VNRHLLFDGDVLAYRAAAAVEKAIEWEPGYWTWHSDEMEARRAVEREIEKYMDALDGYDFCLALTDDAHNFRKDILPTYKGNRKQKKPLVLKSIRAWMLDEFDTWLRPGLEGDDILGILATWPKFAKTRGKPIIVSIDKDMKTVPCTYVRDLDIGPVEITEHEADYWHLFQTLTGDQVDGYAGCPGIGPKKAEAILQQAIDENAHLSGTITYCCWPAVVAAYADKGLSEEVALEQARVARILRASDYDFKQKRPILWTPAPESGDR
jgi:DNA polymerase-1